MRIIRRITMLLILLTSSCILFNTTTYGQKTESYQTIGKRTILVQNYMLLHKFDDGVMLLECKDIGYQYINSWESIQFTKTEYIDFQKYFVDIVKNDKLKKINGSVKYATFKTKNGVIIYIRRHAYKRYTLRYGLLKSSTWVNKKNVEKAFPLIHK